LLRGGFTGGFRPTGTFFPGFCVAATFGARTAGSIVIYSWIYLALGASLAYGYILGLVIGTLLAFLLRRGLTGLAQ